MLHINTITILMTNVSQRFSHLRKSYTNAVLRAIFLSGTITKCDCAHTFWMVNTFRIFSISLLFGGGRGGGLSHPSLYPD